MIALALTGPTASGKTALSIHIAESLGAEIISCDSMQIYRGMDIGTAKATASERAAVPHHLIDFLSPLESYSAERYRADALACASELTERGVLPLFVGGTGLYIDTLMRAPVSAVPESDPGYRERMLALAASEGGVDILWNRLSSVDPESAEKTHKNNVKRVIRALEIYDVTGVPKSQHDRESLAHSADISIGMITLDVHDRENLYRRVDTRVDMMIREGLLDEVRALYGAGLLPEHTTASQAIGYKELISYIEGRATLDEATELLKLSSRRYAKRQLTWFRHEEAERVYIDTESGDMKSVTSLCDEALSAAKRLTDKLHTQG